MSTPSAERLDWTKVWTTVAINHPGVWCVLAVGVFGHLSVLPVNSWNVEILIARNLLRGHGFVVGPLDPPALWRPPLAVLALLPIELLAYDPETIYLLYSTLCLTVSSVALFYLMKRIAGLPAAHVSQLFLFATPLFIDLAGSQIQLMAYTAMLATVLLALLATIAQWSKPTLAGDGRVGLAWGMVFLARPETSLLYGATLFCSGLVYRSRARRSGTPWQGLATQAVTFGVIYLSTMAAFSHVQRTHDLLGQVPLVTFYAGEYFAAGATENDIDGDGYAASVSRFGTPDAYSYSLLRFAAAQPRAVLTRVRQNAGHAAALLSGDQLVRWSDWLAFALLASVLALSTPPPVNLRVLALYGLLLAGGSCYFLLFHVDPRYVLALVLILLCVTLVATAQLWRWMAKGLITHRHRAPAMIVCAAVAAGLCLMRVAGALEAAPKLAVDTTTFRDLADRFRKEHGPGGTPALGFWPPNSDAMFWLSYFADTAIPWLVDTSLFPRDRIYSFSPRADDYSLVPASTDLAVIGSPPVLWRWFVPGFGDYVCVARNKAGTAGTDEGVRGS